MKCVACGDSAKKNTLRQYRLGIGESINYLRKVVQLIVRIYKLV